MAIQEEKLGNLTDIHCHFLPGVDDGAPDPETSLALLDRAYRDGVRAVILTPHYRLGMFENTEEEIRSAYGRLRRAAGDRFPDLELYLGCELHAHMDMVEGIKARPQFRMAGSDYVLVEFSATDEQSYMRQRLYELRTNGFEPIVAHAERYRNLVKDMNFVRSLVDLGVRLQVNADSVLGKAGWGPKRFCRELMERDLLYFIGSDAHDPHYRPPRMGECAAWLEKKMGPAYARRILCENFKEIIHGGSYGDQ